MSLIYQIYLHDNPIQKEIIKYILDTHFYVFMEKKNKIGVLGPPNPSLPYIVVL